MATPHINASKGDFAKVVLMPGDPLRAKWIAENYLSDVRLVNEVRGALGFTGKGPHGGLVSVMASGMGMPSIGIYSHELFAEFGVESIIRIGTCQSVHLSATISIIIRFGLNEGVEGIYHITVAHNHHTHTAYTGAFKISGLKIYCCKIFHHLIFLIHYFSGL